MPHFAYLDPATGTLIISAIVGFFAAVALLIKNFWYKIKGFFGGKEQPQVDQAGEPESEDSRSQ
jgi:hypothetical protein